MDPTILHVWRRYYSCSPLPLHMIMLAAPFLPAEPFPCGSIPVFSLAIWFVVARGIVLRVYLFFWLVMDNPPAISTCFWHALSTALPFGFILACNVLFAAEVLFRSAASCLRPACLFWPAWLCPWPLYFVFGWRTIRPAISFHVGARRAADHSMLAFSVVTAATH